MKSLILLALLGSAVQTALIKRGVACSYCGLTAWERERMNLPPATTSTAAPKKEGPAESKAKTPSKFVMPSGWYGKRDAEAESEVREERQAKWSYGGLTAWEKERMNLPAVSVVTTTTSAPKKPAPAVAGKWSYGGLTAWEKERMGTNPPKFVMP